MIDQLDFGSSDTSSFSVNNVPLLATITPEYHNKGVDILKYPSLMGIFTLDNPPSTQTISVNLISYESHDTSDKGKSIVDSTLFAHFEEN